MARQLVLTVTDDVIDRILRVVHGERLMRDHFQFTRGSYLYEVGLGCPTVGDVDIGRDRVAARLDLWIEERPIVGLPIAASSRRAVIDAATYVGLTSSDAELLWTLDLSSTPTSAITVNADDTDTADRLREVCRDLLGTMSVSFTSPTPTIDSVELRHAAVVRAAADGHTALMFTSSAIHALTPPAHPRAGEDWVMTLDAATVRNLVVDAARVTFGGWPEGADAQPLLLDYQESCGLDTPLGCLGSNTARTYLDEIHLDLARGALVLSGTVGQVNSAFYIPDWTATFTVRLGWQFQGIQPQLVVLGIDVHVDESLVATQVRGLLRARIEGALSGSLRRVTAEVIDMPIVGDDFMGKLLERGSGPRTGVTVTWSRMSIGPDGFAFAGRYNLLETTHPPVARLTVGNTRGSPGRKLLSAALTRTPADRLRRITWRWGDGSSDVSDGEALRVARQHEYGAGRHTATVEVEDSDGGRERASLTFTSRALRLVHRPLPGAAAWTVCDRPGPHDLHFLALSDETPLEGVEVELRGPSWSARGVSDSSGEARVTVHRENGWNPPLVPGGFTIGRLEVTASARGQVPFGPRFLAVHDCKTATADAGGSLVHQFAELAKRGRDVEARSPRAMAIDDVTATMAVLAPLIQVLEQGTVPAALADLLGVSTTPELVNRVRGAMNAVGSQVSAQLDGRHPLVGPSLEAPERYGRADAQPAGDGWQIDRGEPT